MALMISSPDSAASSAIAALAVTTAKVAANAIDESKVAATIRGQAQKIVASGATAVSVAVATTRYDGAAAGDNITSSMANGAFAGQRKVLIMETITATKTAVITPANFFNGTTITLSTPLDAVEVEWDTTGTKWFIVGMAGTPVIV